MQNSALVSMIKKKKKKNNTFWGKKSTKKHFSTTKKTLPWKKSTKKHFCFLKTLAGRTEILITGCTCRLSTLKTFVCDQVKLVLFQIGMHKQLHPKVTDTHLHTHNESTANVCDQVKLVLFQIGMHKQLHPKVTDTHLHTHNESTANVQHILHPFQPVSHNLRNPFTPSQTHL